MKPPATPILLAALILLLPQASLAQRTYNARDLALLPSWCKYTQDFRDKVPGGNNPAEIKRLMESTHGVFHALHHYCWGLILSNEARLFVRDPQIRASKFRISISEFDYVIERSPPDFMLLPEIHTKKAESLLGLRRGPAAVAEFERAIKLKPDYWPAYIGLSQYYVDTGKQAKAREVLEAGLASAPDAAPLKERLGQLGSQRAKPAAK